MERGALKEGKRPTILSSERMDPPAPASIDPIAALLLFLGCYAKLSPGRRGTIAVASLSLAAWGWGSRGPVAFYGGHP